MNADILRSFVCPWEHCGKSFSRKGDLYRHCRIHTNERPYGCKYCKKRFIQRSALNVHVRTHTGEKPYVCERSGCGKAFADSSSFARHRRMHLKASPCTCGNLRCRVRSKQNRLPSNQRRAPASHKPEPTPNNAMPSRSSQNHIHIAPSPIPLISPKPDQHDPFPDHAADCAEVLAPSSPYAEPLALLTGPDQMELGPYAPTTVSVAAAQQPSVPENFLFIGPVDIYPPLEHQYPQYMPQAYWDVGYDVWTATYT
ncbi:hypothetical protein BJY01DRAFT_229500 [Aspergillus pseudoustus]|uniref:C2H2-type domain-containing protein n=1 Tax=Aspergillus pseudoustus TaxID=1810923 RepID=A0ABR4IGP2_9EURO